jgi:DNA-binding response OmpR family regulator
MRLLMIEDESDIALPLKSALEKKGFAIDYFDDGKTGLQEALVNQYDCILLDLNLPGIDGLEIARKLKESEIDTPILMLTARSTQANKIEGFEVGTDDYLVKPFDFKELVYRVKALIRRSSLNKSIDLFCQDITLNTVSKKVLRNGEEIELNLKEYGILEYLLRNKGRHVSQEELLEHVWDQEIDNFSQTVKTNVKTLRQKIDPDKRIIKTVRGMGYIIDNEK